MLSLLQHCGRNLLTARTLQTVSSSYYSAQMGKRVAVVLAGCGVYDGSEIHEASAVLVHLSRGGATVSVTRRFYLPLPLEGPHQKCSLASSLSAYTAPCWAFSTIFALFICSPTRERPLTSTC